MRYAIDSSKLRKLGWEPKYDFEKGIEETVSWFKENDWWWKKIVESTDYKNYYQKQYKSN